MPLLIHTAYLPPIAYCAEVISARGVFIEAMETYPKQTIRNHCAIYGPNGVQILTVPVSKPSGNHTLTRDIRIAGHSSWQRAHWRSIQTAYNNSPFFLYYQDELHPFFIKRYHFLIDFNLDLLHTILKILKVRPSVQITTVYKKKPAEMTDLRNRFNNDHHLTSIRFPAYTQVFEPVHGFLQGLSFLDLLCNAGPEAVNYLSSLHADLFYSRLSAAEP